MQKTFLTFLFLICTLILQSQVKIVSWNLENLGKSKKDSTLTFIANTLKDYDVVAVQEVVAGFGGARSVAKLTEKLNETGAKWDYTLSNPTSGTSYKTERYAFLWKTNKTKLKGKAWLDQNFHAEIDREPFLGTFEYKNQYFTLVNFHAITKSKQPETEIKYLKFYPDTYPDLNLIFIGDFNCPQSHTVFNPLKKNGYVSVFTNQKTTLKQNCISENCLASEFDNIFYNSNKFVILELQAIHFYTKFKTLKEARKISDHIPIAVTLEFKKI